MTITPNCDSWTQPYIWWYRNHEKDMLLVGMDPQPTKGSPANKVVVTSKGYDSLETERSSTCSQGCKIGTNLDPPGPASKNLDRNGNLLVPPPKMTLNLHAGATTFNQLMTASLSARTSNVNEFLTPDRCPATQQKLCSVTPALWATAEPEIEKIPWDAVERPTLCLGQRSGPWTTTSWDRTNKWSILLGIVTVYPGESLTFQWDLNTMAAFVASCVNRYDQDSQ